MPATTAFAIMERQLAHMVRLVDDLLDIARIASGKVQLAIERVQAQDVIAHAIEISMPQIEAAGHRLTLSLDEEALPLDADRCGWRRWWATF